MNEELVSLDQGRFHVAMEGDGPVTVLILSGSGILFPHLEYAPLADCLSKTYSVLIPSKFGYGPSDITQASRDVDTVVEEYRSALAALGRTGPYVLAAHSVSFLEALRWAQNYPEEISALVGLDPATPDAYTGVDLEDSIRQLERLHKPAWKRRLIFGLLARSFLVRYPIPFRQRRALRPTAQKNFASIVWVNESRALPKNLQQIAQPDPPTQIPTFFLLSNGKGALHPQEEWRTRALHYLSQFAVSESQLFDLPHDLYRYRPQTIAEAIEHFLSSNLPGPSDDNRSEPNSLEECLCSTD